MVHTKQEGIKRGSNKAHRLVADDTGSHAVNEAFAVQKDLLACTKTRLGQTVSFFETRDGVGSDVEHPISSRYSDSIRSAACLESPS